QSASRQQGFQQEQAGCEVSDQKARVTLGVITGTFLVCWLPFFCVNVPKAWKPHAVGHLLFQCVTWLGYANSTLNPVIYSIFNRDFRRAFRPSTADTQLLQDNSIPLRYP
ncbi:MAG: hypothetical protein GY821_12445, partial [Gammaproteobacteria bacterium]|nr:hypothetical protein [Gammaproteobacteria bacterium]